MSRLHVKRRPDGVIELNRLRVRDLLVHPAHAVMLALFAVWLALVCTLAAVVVRFPAALPAIGLMLPGLVLGLWGAQVARSPRLAPAPVRRDDPPPRNAA